MMDGELMMDGESDSGGVVVRLVFSLMHQLRCPQVVRRHQDSLEHEGES